jgi:predicted ribosomally synthesized peptide with nif11-like leader
MEVNQKVKNFFMKLGEDEELRGKLEIAAGRQDLAECALLSKEAGFDFTRADLEYLTDLGKAYQNGELSDEQLELVSGGSVTCTFICMAIAGMAAIIFSAVVGGLAGSMITVGVVYKR